MYVGTRVPTGFRAVREVVRYLWSWIISPYSPVITVYSRTWRCVIVSCLLYYILSQCIMSPSNGNIFRVTDLLYGESIGQRWIPLKRPVTWSFDVFFDLRLNKRLSKQSWSWWFETPSCSLWRHLMQFLLCVTYSLPCLFMIFHSFVKAIHIEWSHGDIKSTGYRSHSEIWLLPSFQTLIKIC